MLNEKKNQKKIFVILLFISLLFSSHRIRNTSKILVISIVIIITWEVSVPSDQRRPNYLSDRRKVKDEIKQHFIHSISTHELH